MLADKQGLLTPITYIIHECIIQFPTTYTVRRHRKHNWTRSLQHASHEISSLTSACAYYAITRRGGGQGGQRII